MRVRDWMSDHVVVTAPDESLEGAIVRMDRHAVRHLIVIDHDRCVGVVSDRDLLLTTGWLTQRAHRLPDGSWRVGDVMSTALETAQPDDDLSTACRRLVERRIGCLPVLEGEHVVGVLTERDLLRACQKLQRERVDEPFLDPPLGKVMSRDLIALTPDMGVREAFARCGKEGVRHFCVLYDGWFVGLVSDRDLRQCIGRGEADVRHVGDIMVKDVVTLPPTARLAAAVETLVLYRFSAIPVVEARKLAGVVTSANVISRLARHLEGASATT